MGTEDIANEKYVFLVGVVDSKTYVKIESCWDGARIKKARSGGECVFFSKWWIVYSMGRETCGGGLGTKRSGITVYVFFSKL